MNKFLDDLLEGGKPWHCPTCGRFTKVYRRKLNSTVAKQLIHLYKSGGDKEFLHSKYFVNGTGSGDLTKGKYFKLIESASNYDKGKKNSGLWRLTQLGIDFVLGSSKIPKYIFIFNDKVQGVSQIEVGIQESLGEKFNYQQLMKN